MKPVEEQEEDGREADGTGAVAVEQVRNLLGGGPRFDAAGDGEPDDERSPRDPGHGDGGRGGLAGALDEERAERLLRGDDVDSDGDYGDD